MRILPVIVLFAMLGTAAGVGATMLEFGWKPRHTSSAMEVLLTDDAARPLPRVQVDQEEYDFGRMERDSKLKHTFVVKNIGEAPLTLKEVATTCKCTIGSLRDGQVPPGGWTEVVLEWTALTNSSSFRQSATIETNDPRRPRITLTVFGKVFYAHSIVPQTLVFSGVGAESTRTERAKIYAFSIDDLAISGHELTGSAPAQFFDVKTEPLPAGEYNAEGAKSGALVSVTVKPGLPLGPFQQTIRLRTNLADTPVLEIPVEGAIVGNVSIAGGPDWNRETNVLTLGRAGVVKSAEGAKAELKLIVRGQQAGELNVSVTNVDPSLLKVTAGQTGSFGNARVVPITVELPKGLPPMNHLGTNQGSYGQISLRTGGEDGQDLHLKVRFLVEP